MITYIFNYIKSFFSSVKTQDLNSSKEIKLNHQLEKQRLIPYKTNVYNNQDKLIQEIKDFKFKSKL
jgi:hypothetical protein